MGKKRSRSRSRSRNKDRRKHRKKSVSRSSSRSGSYNSKYNDKKYTKIAKKEEIRERIIEVKEEKVKKVEKPEINEEELMKNLLGFQNFDTTKNKSHVESDLSAVFKGTTEKRKYRQYMNRRGGFNRPLDKME